MLQQFESTWWLMAKREDDDDDDSIEIIDDDDDDRPSFPPAKRMKLGEYSIYSARKDTCVDLYRKRLTFLSNQIFLI